MRSLTIHTHSQDETIAFGRRCARLLQKGDIVCLTGDLGSGKTTFVKGVAAGFTIAQARVTSPTFVLLNIYDGAIPLYHFDLYRLDDISAIAAIGYDEFLYGTGVSLIEWAERLGPLSPKEYIRVKLYHAPAEGRRITVTAKGARYERFMEKIRIA